MFNIQAQLFERVLQVHPDHPFTFTVLCYLKYYNPLQQQVTVSFICVFVAVAARTHHRAHARTLARTLTYTQTQANRRALTAPLNYAQFVGSLFIGSLRFLLFLRALTHGKHKHKHYYAGFLLLFIIVVFPVVVALVVNVCPLTSKHALRTSLFSTS